MLGLLGMLAGLAIFLGVHSLAMLAPAWRQQQIARLGINGWKGAYSLASLVGLVIAIWGFGAARVDPVWLWHPPVALRHLVSLLMLPAMVLFVAAYVPRNHLRARLGHPMVLSVKVWALAHLLANGALHEVIFFAAFLVWAIVLFAKSRRRDRANPPVAQAVSLPATGVAVAIGVAAWLAFALFLHVHVTGVPVFSR